MVCSAWLVPFSGNWNTPRSNGTRIITRISDSGPTLLAIIFLYVTMGEISFSVSCRGKMAIEEMGGFLSASFPEIPLAKMDSVFGFVEQSTLYGGRQFISPELSDRDIVYLAARGVGVKLPLSNHFVSEEEYAQNHFLLERFHHRGNAAVVVNDDLARWLRRDFSLYSVEASVIKDIRTHEDIDQTLELYDTVVLPMDLNNNLMFLENISAKDRIRLFANGGCAYNCPLKLCYKSISSFNKYAEPTEFKCSQATLYRPQLGVLNFDLERLQQLGFSRFKWLRNKGLTGF